MSAVIVNPLRDPQWLPKKMQPRMNPRKNLSGHLPEHLSALSDYAALPWYTRAVKHSRAWFGNKRLALRMWVLSQGRG